MVEQKYVIGIDGGGTRSRGVAVGVERGDVFAATDGDPLNFYTTSIEEFQENLGDLWRRLANRLESSRCLHGVVGTAALLDKPNAEELLRVTAGVPAEFSSVSLSVVGDAVTAVMGATGGNQGLLVISGTGSVAVAIGNNGAPSFSGGLGPLIGGDPGSAFWMASEAVLTAQRQSAQGDDSALGSAICDFFEIPTLVDLIPVLYGGRTDSKRLASLSGFLSGGERALPEWTAIEDRAGQRLAELAAPLYRSHLEPGASIHVAGSVLGANTNVRSRFCGHLAELLGHSVVAERPRFDAPSGAAMIALKAAGYTLSPPVMGRLASLSQ